jgi:hypothetical protein
MKDVEERGAVPSVPSQSARQRESMDIDPHVNPGECKDFCYSHYILFSICIFVAQRVDEKKQSTASGFRPSTTIPKSDRADHGAGKLSVTGLLHQT